MVCWFIAKHLAPSALDGTYPREKGRRGSGADTLSATALLAFQKAGCGALAAVFRLRGWLVGWLVYCEAPCTLDGTYPREKGHPGSEGTLSQGSVGQPGLPNSLCCG